MANDCASVIHRIMIVVIAFLLVASLATGDDASTLIKFKDSIRDDKGALTSWDPLKRPCVQKHSNWTGVRCSINGDVHKLVLDGLGLSGELFPAVEPLAELQFVVELSFANNSFQGSMPTAVQNMSRLSNLVLSRNNLSGTIDDQLFVNISGLAVLDMDHNRFSGNIPSSLSQLPRLTELLVQNNNFTGSIPELSQTPAVFDFSNNDLEGPIPDNLKDKGSGPFLGNKDLCGPPLSNQCSPQAAPTNGTMSSKSKRPILIAVLVVGIPVVLLLLGGVYFLVTGPRRRRGYQASARKSSRQQQPAVAKFGRPVAKNAKIVTALGPQVNNHGHDEEDSIQRSFSTSSVVAAPLEGAKTTAAPPTIGQLVFVGEQVQRRAFGLDDLLHASAEVLGSGGMGSAYKATIPIVTNTPTSDLAAAEGTTSISTSTCIPADGGKASDTVVVKRYKEMTAVSTVAFSEHMTRFGRLSHPNLLPVLAYLNKQQGGDKMLLLDHVPIGSLAHFLHGQIPADSGTNQPKLDWPSRLRIIKGVARGLAYLYKELPPTATMRLAHGHLKSSNVLLTESYDPLLTDYALLPITNPTHARRVMMAFKAPEVAQGGSAPTSKADVWALGILILELLTGRNPNEQHGRQGAGGGRGQMGRRDLASWVNSVVREEWTGEVFDSNMGGIGRHGGEMLKLLQIGLGCCEIDVRMRYDLKGAVAEIEVINDSGTDEEGDDCYYSSYISEADMLSSKVVTDEEDFSFSTTK